MVDLKKKKKKSDGVLIITFVLLEREKKIVCFLVGLVDYWELDIFFKRELDIFREGSRWGWPPYLTLMLSS